MSEIQDVAQPCVMGCAKTKTNHESGETTLVPRPASIGHLCDRCGNALLQWLLEIPDLVAMLDPSMERGDIFQPGRRGKISGSPALVRLDVAAMLDPRSVAVARRYMGNPNDPNSRPDPVPKPEDIHFRGDVAGVMCQWADCLCDDLNLMTDERRSERPATLIAAIDLLAGHWWSTLVYRPWIDDMHTEVREIRTTLRGLNNVQDPRPLGRCGCGRMIYEPDTEIGPESPDKAMVECKCGHRMNPVALIRVAARGETA